MRFACVVVAIAMLTACTNDYGRLRFAHATVAPATTSDSAATDGGARDATRDGE